MESSTVRVDLFGCLYAKIPTTHVRVVRLNPRHARYPPVIGSRERGKSQIMIPAAEICASFMADSPAFYCYEVESRCAPKDQRGGEMFLNKYLDRLGLLSQY